MMKLTKFDRELLRDAGVAEDHAPLLVDGAIYEIATQLHRDAEARARKWQQRFCIAVGTASGLALLVVWQWWIFFGFDYWR